MTGAETGGAKRVILSADDFGLSVAVNEAIERARPPAPGAAARVWGGGPPAPAAGPRARALPGLRVGLHLVTIEGPAVLPPAAIPDLVDARGQFPSDQLRLGLAYAFAPRVRRQLAAEIRAQFAAFAATGLTLDHADAHKHMHLHPTVGRLMIATGRDFGLRALRVPAEPPGVIAAAGGQPGFGDRVLFRWTRLLRAQARRAGLTTNDACFGLAWSGHMTADRLLALAPLLPAGLSEIYFHPASRRDDDLVRLMPTYQHTAELEALCDPGVAAALARAGTHRTTYGEETTA